MATLELTLRARYVFPVSKPPIADAEVQMANGRILAVRPARENSGAVDLGDVALLPGLVNAHAHLEFSDLPEPLGAAGDGFASWLREMIQRRRSLREAEDAEATDARRREAITTGLQESLAAGVTAIGEIATQPWYEDLLLESPVHCTALLEILALHEERARELSEIARHHAAAAQRQRNGCRYGLSPHAPYTVRLSLLEEAVRLSAQHRLPLAMHLAESLEELELLQSGSGPLVEVLNEFGAWDPTAVPRGIAPLDYLRILAQAERAIVVHGNYLGSSEIAFLAERADRMGVAYCPRTHHFFGHGRHPLVEMLSAGVTVALGTDSRASNPDLRLLSEARFVARHYPELPPSTVLELATLRGARLLGLDRDRGSLDVGKRADLIVVPIEPAETDDPHELVLGSDRPVEAVYLGGVRVK